MDSTAAALLAASVAPVSISFSASTNELQYRPSPAAARAALRQARLIRRNRRIVAQAWADVPAHRRPHV